MAGLCRNGQGQTGNQYNMIKRQNDNPQSLAETNIIEAPPQWTMMTWIYFNPV